MKKITKIITGFLGISMFSFGALKFVNPFKGWYQQQMEMSELPFQFLSYWSGQLGEIFVGAALILILIPSLIKNKQYRRLIFSSANILIIVMMLVAFYVHMHPEVPPEVLPLNIRPPVIPGFFLLLAVVNLYLGRKAGSGTLGDWDSLGSSKQQFI